MASSISSEIKPIDIEKEEITRKVKEQFYQALKELQNQYEKRDQNDRLKHRYITLDKYEEMISMIEKAGKT